MILKLAVLMTIIMSGLSSYANLCKSVRNVRSTSTSGIDPESTTEETFYRTLFTDTNDHGNATWNKAIIQCNRQRDTQGSKMKRMLTESKFSSIKEILDDADLSEQVVRGQYNFFGKAITRQKYRYALSKAAGVWTMTLFYDEEINDVVKNRVDFFIGRKRHPDGGVEGSYTSLGLANVIYEESEIDATTTRSGTTFSLKSTARPIAETLCDTTTFFPGKEKKYDGQDNGESRKRDRTNKHISLGKIQYSYDDKKDVDKTWRDGCRVVDNVDLFWVNKYNSNIIEKLSPRKIIKKNFIATAENYWTRPGVFNLKILLKNFNKSDFAPELTKLLGNGDFLKVRFGTKFMPYGGNQVYKTSAIQYNNFSTMTSDGTFWHEVGHAFGLDDEYGGDKKNGDFKDNGCDHTDYAGLTTSTYQMCNVGTSDFRTIYHYLATSRYLLTQICSKDSDCGSNRYCNKRLGINICRAKSTLAIGESCDKNTECASDKCQGTGSQRACVCNLDSHCGSGQYCNKKIGKNQCLAKSTKELGASCSKNAECSSNKCQGTGSDRSCVCNIDSDCGSGLYCNNRLGKNRCLADSTKELGASCSKNNECSTNKCQGSGNSRACVCAKDSDCPGSQKCKKPVFGKNNCK